jgi:pyruvate dehydrogenase E2 component (dihydrolipoamide acetyltransferase)
MEAGTLIEWLVRPGQAVKRGDIVAVVDTEKAAIDIEIWIEGVVESLRVEPGIRVPVGTVLAIVRVAGEVPGAVSEGAPAAQPTRPPVAPPSGPREAAPVSHAEPLPGTARHRATPLARHVAQDLGVNLEAVTGTGPGGSITRTDVEQAAATPTGAERLRVSPLARRRAKELGVNPNRAKGTGPDGAITQADVERLAAAPKAQVAAMSPTERGAAMRRAIAQAMARSKREIPHYYLGLEVDFGRGLAWLEQENAKRPIEERLLYSVLLIKAVALAARVVPEMNGFWVGDAFQASESVHVGMAISLRAGGLVAPALHDPDRKSLVEIMGELRDLVTRARTGSLRSSELTDPTLTVTNLGEQGVDQVFGIIFPPQVALVGFGRISTRRTLHASLAADHRASDGHRGGVFLAAIDRRLQAPETL